MTRVPGLRLVIWGLVSVFALCAGLATAVVLHPRTAIEKIGSYALERRVVLAELRIAWGETISVRMRGLEIANVADAGPDAMVSIAAIDAQIDRAALLSGRLVYRHLAIERPVIVLARDGQGRGNWRTGSGGAAVTPAVPAGGLALIPKNRRQFPDLIDFTLVDGEIRYRTGSGKWLAIRLDAARIRGDGATGPVHLDLAGSYQGIAARVAVVGGSFDELRDASRPFPLAVKAAASRLRLDFDGTMTEPLDLEGAEGRLDLAAQRAGALQPFFGAADTIGAPLQIAGAFSRHGDDWRLAAARGDLAGNRFDARRLHLREGARGASDTIDLDLAFSDFDLKPVLAEGGDQGAGFRPDAAADAARIDLRVAIASLRNDGRTLVQEVRLRATGRPGMLALEEGSGRLGGGRLSLDATLRAIGARDGALWIEGRLRDARAEQMTGLILPSAGGTAPVHGRLDASFDLGMTGATFDAALRLADGRLVVDMREGIVDRALVGAASTDLGALLRKSGEGIALRCLLGVATLRKGEGSIGPLRLDTADGSFAARGTFDPARRRLDMLVRPDRATTGFLALDIPLRVHGPVADLAIVTAPAADFPTSAMPDSLPGFARGNPCRP
jgi:AsmA family protein